LIVQILTYAVHIVDELLFIITRYVLVVGRAFSSSIRWCVHISASFAPWESTCPRGLNLWLMTL